MIKQADRLHSPLILVGTHRSGTTMVAGVLDRLGVFMGRRKDENNEALFFRDLNRWMLNSVHAHWDYPRPFPGLLADRKLREVYVQYVRILLRSPRLIAYTGVKNYIRYGPPDRWKFLWGWKDPRNTFTLPLWLEIFGGARIVHVRRHGVDVAKSLVARNEKSRKKGIARFDRWRRYPLMYRLRPKKGGFVPSIRCNTLEGAFEIWRQYMTRAEEVLENINVPVLDLCYEQILSQPEIELEKVLRFCGCWHLQDRIAELAAGFDPARAFAFRRNPQGRQFALEHADALNRFGYSAHGRSV
ncbi:MAG: sulfotransferase [Thermodesulfobacteriota bacterium]